LLLHRWNHFYHVLDKPQTEDRLYDLNYNDLKAYETRKKCKTKNSPTQCIGCGCPICNPAMFDDDEMIVWEQLIGPFEAQLNPPAKVRKKSTKATSKSSRSR
jgi:hypothetical protein